MDLQNYGFVHTFFNANKAIITAITFGIIILLSLLSASIHQQRNRAERGWGDEYQSVLLAISTAVILVNTRLKGRSFAMAIMCANMHGPRTPIALDTGKKNIVQYPYIEPKSHHWIKNSAYAEAHEKILITKRCPGNRNSSRPLRTKRNTAPRRNTIKKTRQNCSARHGAPPKQYAKNYTNKIQMIHLPRKSNNAIWRWMRDES